MQYCMIFESFKECSEANDPLCGWCLQDKKCSTKSHCERGWFNRHITSINFDKIPITRSQTVGNKYVSFNI